MRAGRNGPGRQWRHIFPEVWEISSSGSARPGKPPEGSKSNDAAFGIFHGGQFHFPHYAADSLWLCPAAAGIPVGGICPHRQQAQLPIPASHEAVLEYLQNRKLFGYPLALGAVLHAAHGGHFWPGLAHRTPGHQGPPAQGRAAAKHLSQQYRHHRGYPGGHPGGRASSIPRGERGTSSGWPAT